MAERMKFLIEKKTVPVNVLLTEEANGELSKFALQVSTPEERISKSDIVRATLEAGLPLFDLVKKLNPELPIGQVPELLTRKPVIETIQKLAQQSVPMMGTRAAVRARGGVRTRGSATIGPSEGIELVSPVNTGVYQAPTLSWKLDSEMVKAHLDAKTDEPIKCRVRVIDDEQEVWHDMLEITLPKGAKSEKEAQIPRSVSMPPEVFEQLSSLSWKRWTVQVSYHSPAGRQEREASALFLKVTPYQAARAEVEGLLGRGRSYEAQGLLEESATFFRETLEMSCQQLIDTYRIRGLTQTADEYQRLLEEIKKLH